MQNTTMYAAQQVDKLRRWAGQPVTITTATDTHRGLFEGNARFGNSNWNTVALRTLAGSVLVPANHIQNVVVHT